MKGTRTSTGLTPSQSSRILTSHRVANKGSTPLTSSGVWPSSEKCGEHQITSVRHSPHPPSSRLCTGRSSSSTDDELEQHYWFFRPRRALRVVGFSFSIQYCLGRNPPYALGCRCVCQPGSGRRYPTTLALGRATLGRALCYLGRSLW